MQELIITTSKIKKEILKENSKNKVISNVKVLSISDARKMALGSISDDARYLLRKEFNLDLSYIKVILDNVLYKRDDLKIYYDYLDSNNLIKRNICKEEYKTIKCINVMVDDYIKEYFNKDIFKYKVDDKKYNHEINIFNDYESEIVWVAESILTNGYKFSDVKLVNVLPEYKKVISKVFSMYNIPINIGFSYSVYKSGVFRIFIKSLEDSRDIGKAIDDISACNIKDIIIGYFNGKNYEVIDDIAIEIIKDDFKNICVKEDVIKDAVSIIDIFDIYNKDNIYYLMGFNDSVPKKYKDEDYYSDIDKVESKILSSKEKNKLSLNIFENIFNGTKNLYVSYSLKSSFLTYNPSTFIKDNDLVVNNITDINFNLSNRYNRLLYSKKVDEYISYGVSCKDLEILNSNYSIPYKEYDNKFKGLLNKEIDIPIKLSYSSIKTFYECGFKYYLDNVLKLGKFEETLSQKIGNVFHHVLSRMYDDNFDMDKEYDKELSELSSSNMELFFLNKLKKELENIIKFLRSFDSDSSLNSNICENKFVIEDIIKDKVSLKGFIDNIKLNYDKKIIMLIDYKTGNVETTLDNINYGLNLQLPIYLYLISSEFKDYKIGGFYLSKILENKKMGEEDATYKFEGYSTTNEEVLEKLDSTYKSSNYIKGLKLTNNGFYSYSKVLDECNIDKVMNVAKDKVLEASNKIVNKEFYINPKMIDKKYDSCEYCKYKDICFKTYEDEVNLENTKLKDIIGLEE